MKTAQLDMNHKIKESLNAPINPEMMQFIFNSLPDNQKFDDIRFYKSLVAIQAIIAEFGSENRVKILELGASGLFTELMYKYIPNIEVYHVLGVDYRKVINTNQKFDLIIAMEIIEHLGDLDSDNVYVFSTFLHTGLDGFFNNLKNNFHQQTRMLITTPNVNSYFQLFNLINCKNPYMYDLHIHEYGVYELKKILESQFKLEYYDTMDLLNVNHYGFKPEFIEDITKVFKKYYSSHDLNSIYERGTNIVTVLKLK